MEQRGHACAIFLFDPFNQEKRPAHELREEIVEHFIPVQATVFRGLDDLQSADVAIATNWWTAYPLRDRPGIREKVYLVQDDEPAFYATSASSLWAEETYRMGYRCIAFTPWMAEILRERYGAEARWFECGSDLDTYTFTGPEEREPGARRGLRAHRDRAPRGRARDRRDDDAGRAAARHEHRALRLQPPPRRAGPDARTWACATRGSSPRSTAARAPASCSR